MFKLIGRIESDGGLFTISSTNYIGLWKGVNNHSQPNDYDLICEMFDFEKRLYTYKEKLNIFRCDCKVLLIFKDLKGNIAILEQDYIDDVSILEEEINIEIGSSIELNINIENHSLIIFDSTLDSSEIKLNGINGISNSNPRFPNSFDIFNIITESSKYNCYNCSYLVPNKINLIGIILIPVIKKK